MRFFFILGAKRTRIYLIGDVLVMFESEKTEVKSSEKVGLESNLGMDHSK